MKKPFLIFIVICAALSVNAQKLQVFPKPQQVTTKQGFFTIYATTVLVTDGGEENSVNFLNDYLASYYGFRLKTALSAESNFINLSSGDQAQKGKEEGYSLTVEPASINIAGNTHQGTFYGIQTLLQLLPAQRGVYLKIPSMVIKDEPRFAYRGMMLDVCRHFFTVDFVKKYIDYLAFFKLNRFHWHLTDDQGWRIEIKRYPKLTSVGGYRYGTIIGHAPGTGSDNHPVEGFYTQDQIREVVKYAADRYITVIPEIEMPGHASAAIAAYPSLSCFPDEPTVVPTRGWFSTGAITAQAAGTKKVVTENFGVFPDVYCPSDSTFRFLENVLDEVMTLFPSKYIHIGGDECPKSAWKRSAFCQQLIKDKGLKNEEGLQSYFIQHMEKYLNSKGRQIIGWDEILEGGLAPNATVMSWRGLQGGIDAARQGHDVVMTPGEYVYFDHSQNRKEDSLTIGGYLPLEKVYSYDPVPGALSAVEALHVTGAQANLWTEYITNPAKVEYMIFPRLAALSEILWTRPENKNLDNFMQRLPALTRRLKTKGVHYNSLQSF